MRFSVIASHPVQYQAPLYRALAACENVEVLVHYGFLPDAVQQGEGFGVGFQWDLPLLEGYRHEVFFLDGSKAGGGRGLRAVGRLGRSLRAYNPDVIFCTGWHHPSMVAGLAAAVWSGKPRLLRCEANVLRSRGLGAQIFHRAMLTLYRAVLPIGQANREYYRAFGVAESRMFDAPYFIDNDRFTEVSSAADRSALRQRWGVPQEAFCFLFSGKLEEKKHPLSVVEAMRGLSGAHLLVVGSGPLEGALREACRRHGLSFSFTGFLNQSEMPLAYRAADSLVLPSDAGETWGLVVNEAMACGLPAIVSDRVGCRADLVLEGETGLSFPFGDLERLGQQMKSLVAAPARARAMGAAARERVCRDYSVGRAAAGVMQAAEAVLKK